MPITLDPNFKAVHAVTKSTIIKRLEEADKFNEAVSILRSDELLYEKWSAAPIIHSNDAPARDLFAAIGLDPDVILAEE